MEILKTQIPRKLEIRSGYVGYSIRHLPVQLNDAIFLNEFVSVSIQTPRSAIVEDMRRRTDIRESTVTICGSNLARTTV